MGFWKTIKNLGNNKEKGTRPYSTPTKKMEFGEAIIEFIATNRVNQIESRPLWPETTVLGEETKAVLERSHFAHLRKISARDTSLEGRMFQMFSPYGESFIMDSFKISKIAKGTLDNPREIHLNTSSVYIQENDSFPIQMVLEWNGLGKAVLSQYIVDKEGQRLYIEEKTHTYEQNLSRLPGQVMKANYRGLPDIDNSCVRSIIEHYEFHSNELTTEWKYVATKIRNNPNFSDFDDDELEKHMEELKRIIPEASYNNKLQQGQEVFTSGSQSITYNQINIQFLEDKILKYAGVIRESTSSGTNKHSLEITLQNQYATEILYSIRDLREWDYKMLFRSLAELTGETSLENVIELKVSLIEEAKIALLQESVEAAKNNGSLSKNRNEES